MTYSATVLATNPIRYYRLGEATGTVATDVSSGAHNGTITGGVTLAQPGLLVGDTDTAMLFDGSTGYINLPTTGLPTGASAWSVEAWVKLPATLVDFKNIFFLGTLSTNQCVQCFYYSSTFGVAGQSGTNTMAGGTVVASGVYHVVVTYDGTTTKLYVNGALATSLACTWNLTYGTALIGQYWSGILDEVAIHTTALSAAQVLYLYQLGTAPPSLSIPLFPPDHIWNTPIASAPTHASSAAWIAAIGGTIPLQLKTNVPPTIGGIPYNLVNNSTPTYLPTITYGAEAYTGPFPIPAIALYEEPGFSGSDHHLLCLNTDTGILYEMDGYNGGAPGAVTGIGAWAWDLTSYTLPAQIGGVDPATAMSAGMAVLPGLVRYDEIVTGIITHALYMALPLGLGYGHQIWPAKHNDGSTAGYPPQGARFRLKASKNISGYSATNQVILQALKTYGCFNCDSGTTSQFRLQGVPDSRWNMTDLGNLAAITAADFEVVDESAYMVSITSGQVLTPPGVPYQLRSGSGVMNVLGTTLLAKSTVGRRGELTATVYDPAGATHYQQYQQCSLYDQTGTLAWSGYLTSPVETKPGFQAMLLTGITATDQHYLADKRIVAAVYRNKTCGFMVQDMLTNILAAEGVTVGSIAAGPVVPVANFGYVTVAAALDQLVQSASSSGVPYYWMIDQQKKLWFVPYSAVVGPIVTGTTIDDGRLSGLVPNVTRANPLYRNTQYAVGGVQQTPTQDETLQGDGQTRAFPFKYALNQVPSIFTLNGASKSLGIKGQTGYNYYYAVGDPIIAQDPSQTILVSTDRLRMVYIGQIPGVFSAKNAAQITAQAAIDGTSGIVEAVLNDSTIGSASDGLARCNQLLTQYCQNGLLFQFATRDPSFAAGMLITVTFAPLGFSSTKMLISEVDASDQKDGVNIWYTVNAIAGPYDVTWVEFFGNILKPPKFDIAANISLGIVLPNPLYPQATTLFPQASTLFPG